MWLLSSKNWKNLSPKDSGGARYCWLVGLCPILKWCTCVQGAKWFIWVGAGIQAAHQKTHRLSIRIYLNRPPPGDKWPMGKDKWSLALGKLFSENNSALQILSVRIPGEGKWIVSQGEKNTQEWVSLRGLCVRWPYGRVSNGWRVRNVSFYMGNLYSSN